MANYGPVTSSNGHVPLWMQGMVGNMKGVLAGVNERSHVKDVADTSIVVRFNYRQFYVDGIEPGSPPRMEIRLVVESHLLGDSSTVAMRVISEEQAQQQYPVEFAEFKQHDMSDVDGQPIIEVPFLTSSDTRLLQACGIMTVERAIQTVKTQKQLAHPSAFGICQRVDAWVKLQEEGREAIDSFDRANRYEVAYNEQVALNDDMRRKLDVLQQTLSTLQNAGISSSAIQTPAQPRPQSALEIVPEDQLPPNPLDGGPADFLPEDDGLPEDPLQSD